MARVCHTFLRLLSWWLWIFSWYASSTVQSAPQIQNEKSNKSKPESAAVQWFFNMPSSNPMLNSCVCFVVVAFGWIEVALSAIHKLPESSRCPPRSRACTRWALCVPLCTVWHCVTLCGTALYFAHVGHCTCGNPPFSAALSPTMHFGSFADQGTSLAMQISPLTMDREVYCFWFFSMLGTSF